MTMFLSRLRIARHPSIDALKLLIDPKNLASAMDAHHRLVWSAFAGEPSSKRDFLWRSEGNGSFIVLSQRRPEKALLFEEPEVKLFAPQLEVGNQLDFVLRVNATIERPEKYLEERDGKKINRRVDIVMHRLKGLAAGPMRRESRMNIAHDVAVEWFSEQGRKHGFSLLRCAVANYSVMALPDHRGLRSKQPQFGLMDISGAIKVSDPIAFLSKLQTGFGRAKAFGCGLMLIRRL